MMMSGIGPLCVPPLTNKRPGQTSATNHFDAWPQGFLSLTKSPRFHCPRLLTITIPHHPQIIFYGFDVKNSRKHCGNKNTLNTKFKSIKSRSPDENVATDWRSRFARCSQASNAH